MDKIDRLIINIPHSMLGTENVLIKRISDSQQCHEALELAIKVFMEFEASVTTIVKFNNFLGKIYFIGIWVFHKQLVKSLFRKAIKSK